MYKNNWFKRGAVAAVAAGLMLGALPGVAMAATVGDETTQTIDKTWTLASPSQYDENQSFSFMLTYKEKENAKGSTVAAVDPTGVNNPKTVVIGGKDAANALTKKSDTEYTGSASLASLFQGIDFSTPGQYYFQLEEVKPENFNPNISYSTQKYTVRVNVCWATNDNGDFVDAEGAVTSTPIAKIYSVQVLSGEYSDKQHGDHTDKDAKLNSAAFANTAASNGNVDLKKVVAGTAADTNKAFTFKITVGGQGSYAVSSTNGSNPTSIQAGVETTFTLSHEQTLEIKNLPVGTTYKISESDTNYTEKYTVNDSKLAVGLTTGDQTVVKGADANKVEFRNELGYAAPTGITMNTLPFVGVAAVAAAGAVTLVISRKRRAGEEF